MSGSPARTSRITPGDTKLRAVESHGRRARPEAVDEVFHVRAQQEDFLLVLVVNAQDRGKPLDR